MGFGGSSHVMGQRPAATLPPGDHHLAAQPAQKADGGIVDVGVQRLLGAAGHQGHAHPALPFGGKDLRVVVAADRGNMARCHRQHGPDPPVRHQKGKGPPDPGTQQGQAKAHRMGQDLRQNPAQNTVGQRSAIGLFDVFPRMIHQMPVLHARGAGCHAGQAGQAAVDMADRARVGGAALFQHVLDQVNAPARTVEFVAQHLVGRAGGGAQAAVHAGPQDLVRPRHGGVFQLIGRECRLHRRVFRYQPIRPGFRMPRGSNFRRRAAASAASGAGWG